MLPTLVGAHRLQQEALSQGAEAIVVDTTGLVDPSQGGKALKQWKIELLGPTLVIALQRRQELEPILWPLRRDGRVRTAELDVSPQVRKRSREERVAHRHRRFAHYFEGSGLLTLKLGQLAVYEAEHMADKALLAFQDEQGLTLELGVVQEADRRSGSVTIRTPLPEIELASSIRFGEAHFDLSQR
jgi:polynucleotide 5'-hydroxyl-kinase GRC3/NOL9